MLQKLQSGIYQSSLLSAVAGLTHGYSTRRLGNMRDRMKREAFLKCLSVSPYTLVTAEQVHGSEVALVETRANLSTIKGVDGLVWQARDKGQKALGVFVADCLPLLLVDAVAKVLGVAHAGWKGTIAGIAQKAVKAMRSAGSEVQNILISLGPHIGMCCYDVPQDRARQFVKLFGNDPRVVSLREGKWQVDLGYANYLKIIASHVLPQNIDAPATCTSCQASQFYSYRKDSKETFGEMMGVIGFR